MASSWSATAEYDTATGWVRVDGVIDERRAARSAARRRVLADRPALHISRRAGATGPQFL